MDKRENLIKFIILPLAISVLWGILMILLLAKGPVFLSIVFNSFVPGLAFMISPFLVLILFGVSIGDLWVKYVRKRRIGTPKFFYLFFICIFLYYATSFLSFHVQAQYLKITDQKAFESAKHVAEYYIENEALPKKVPDWKGESEEINFLGIESTLTYEPDLDTNNFIVEVFLRINPGPRLWQRDVKGECLKDKCIIQRYREDPEQDGMIEEEIKIERDRILRNES
ncbi:MAG: hypothetical protein PHY73_05035 [Candidatus Omnitrophica bacterium]|nr:hypothetical protein [Candidatus Omnitrophota bacterium]